MYHLLLDKSRQIPNSGYLGGELSEASSAQLTGMYNNQVSLFAYWILCTVHNSPNTHSRSSLAFESICLLLIIWSSIAVRVFHFIVVAVRLWIMITSCPVDGVGKSIIFACELPWDFI